MQLKISHSLSLPLEAVTQTFAILAKRGVGKTYTGAVMAEEMLEASQQIVVADPIGVWWGLRSSADGKSAGYPIVVFGGERADVPLEENSGEIIAGAVVENGFSAILDISLLRKNSQVRFMTAFAETLYRLNRKPLHLFVDEADAFAPQRPMKGEERLLGAFEDIVRRGRARGLGVTLITQRAAVINKNVLTQIEVLVALRTISPQDRDALQAWIEVHGSESKQEQFFDSLASLPIGTAWFWSPGWLDIFKRVEIRKRRTFDSSSTPEVGKQVVIPKEVALVDLEKLGEQIKSTVARAKENDPLELKKEIRSLKTQLKAQPQISKPVAQAVEIKTIPALTDAERKRLTKLIDTHETFIATFNSARSLMDLFSVAKDGMRDELVFFKNLLAGKLLVLPQKEAGQTRLAKLIAPAAPRPVLPLKRDNGFTDYRGEFPVIDPPLGKCERSLLSVVAKYPEGCTRGKLILLAGYAWSGSTQNALGKLRSLGLVEGANNSLIRITEAGMASGSFQPLPEGDGFRNYWLTFPHFGKCERSLLRCLIDNPNGLARDELLQTSGYEWSGSTQNALGALRTAGVIVGRNNETLRAADEFFT